jgi:hypothetical protein
VIAAHLAAARALIPSGISIHEVHVPADPTYPYVVLRLRTRQTAHNLADQNNNFEGVLNILHAGLNDDSVMVIQDRIRAAFVDVRPAVAARNTWKLRLVNEGNVREDTGVTIPVTNTHPIVVVDEYRLASTPG